MSLSKARRVAVEVIYACLFNDDMPLFIEEHVAERLSREIDKKLADRIVYGYLKKRNAVEAAVFGAIRKEVGDVSSIDVAIIIAGYVDFLTVPSGEPFLVSEYLKITQKYSERYSVRLVNAVLNDLTSGFSVETGDLNVEITEVSSG